MRKQLLGTAAVIAALAVYGPSCRGGKPVIEFEPAPAPSSLFEDGGITSIPDVITIDSGCATSTSRGQLRASNILFVIDRSGSMACNLPQDGQSSQSCAAYPTALFPNRPSKWDLTREAVLAAIGDLRAAGTVSIGLSLFPRNGSQCAVSTDPDLPIAPLDVERERRLAELLGSTSPGGETPIAGATILGYAHLLEEMRSKKLQGETFVVIVTDGYETCKPDEIPKLLDIDVPNARAKMFVRSFVIGAPGSDDGRAFLSEFAVAGGTEASPNCVFGPTSADGDCHFDMTRTTDFSSDLMDALVLINSEVMACTVDIPTPPNGGPVNLHEVNVLVNGVSRPMVDLGKCSSTDGWRYSEDLTTILLCGNACRAAKQSGAEVTVILGCPTTLQ